MRKIILVVIDGGSDYPLEELGGKTPFEYANTPNLDYIARNGKNGLIKVLPIPPESDQSMFALLGYDVFKVYTGRGPLEALGAGIRIKEGEVAIRTNFATVYKDIVIDPRAGEISTSEAKRLEEEIHEKVKIDVDYIFKTTISYRGVLILSSKNRKLSAKISNTHPGYALQHFDVIWDKFKEDQSIVYNLMSSGRLMKVKRCVPLEHSFAASFTANLVNDFYVKSRKVLLNSEVNIKREKEGKAPANALLFRDAGDRLPKVKKLPEWTGLRWACLTDAPAEKGIAELLGMDIFSTPPDIKDMRKEMLSWATLVLKNYSMYDAFYIHLKWPDYYAHLGDAKKKVEAIETIDTYFLGFLLENLDLENTILAVTCDHTTSTKLQAHTEDPVPFSVVGGRILPDHVASFSEKSCAMGRKGMIPARELVPYLIRKAR